ncbi:hypothetical protein WICMUC_000658 [Wickerhamomyces mucosus]|uniref:Uncharacterized protein n=1 Tax=Wickerhamomyces mucosus TaxID=1378264 RepID=A0A9P8PYG7_9ASCO|nr:hypothetical protein WICMUC_000658 [Wickerhamomyces mucosus]
MSKWETEEQDGLVTQQQKSYGSIRTTIPNSNSLTSDRSRGQQDLIDQEALDGQDEFYESDGYSVSIPSSYDERSLVDSLDEVPLSFVEEFSQILKSSIPLSITFFFEYLLAVSSLFVIGHLGSAELASASLAVMTFNITGMAVFEGMATCLDTYCSQAFGAGKLIKVGIYFQRCTLLLFFVSVPIMLFWVFSKSFLQFIVPQKDLLELTQLYLRVLCLGTPGLILFETGKRYLQAQKIFHASTYVLFFCLPLNIIMNYTFIGIWGFIGAPIAIVFTYWIMAGSLLAYVYFIDGSQCWGGFSPRAWKHWDNMLKLAIPGLVMIESEYLSFEILTVMASHFGIESLAAQSIISNIGSLVYQFPFAIASAISTRVAIYIGSGSIKSSKISVRISFLVALITGIIIASSILIFKRQFAILFSSDEEVLKLAVNSMPILAINQIPDTFNIISAAVLRSQGRQKVGSIFNVIAYYVIALPLAYILSFKYGFEISGLWMGLGAGILFLAVAEVVCVIRTNWKEVIEETQKREEDEYEYIIDDNSTIASSASSLIDY